MLESLDKRDFRRMEIDTPARMRLQGEDGIAEVRVRDLSATGVLLWAGVSVAAESTLAVEIPPGTDSTPPFQAMLKVVRCVPLEAGDGEGYSLACAIEKLLSVDEAADYFS
ncbi:MAG: PilZ domain-containing protein [Candidatus Sedimenticola sp. PURPLELP]